MIINISVYVVLKAIIVAIFLIKMPKYTSNAQKIIRELHTDNWTSCEEFLSNVTTFDYNSIIDKDWKIFYFWNFKEERSYNIRFSLANKILVDRFRVEVQKYDSSINWTRAVMFMETSIDFSALYVSMNKPGKFRLIPSIAFELEAVPAMTFALKVVAPGYLGIMNCQYRFCYALAPVDQMPEDKDLTVAAKKLGFTGYSNRSYLVNYNKAPAAPFLEDDSEEDQQVELDNYNSLDN